VRTLENPYVRIGRRRALRPSIFARQTFGDLALHDGAGGGGDVGPGGVEALSLAEPGIGHGLTLSARNPVQQQAEPGDPVVGREAAQVLQIGVIERDDVVEAGEVGARDLTRAKGCDVDAVPGRDGDGPLIRRLARMPVPRACGIDDQIEPPPRRLGPQGTLGERRATDVAEADEEEGV